MNKILFALIVTTFVAPVAYGQGTLTITFDGPPVQPPDSQYGITSYSESGMSFTTIPTWVGLDRNNNAGGLSGYPDDGSAYIQSTSGAPVVFNFTDGSVFGLDSVDLTGYSTVVPDFDVQFVGYHPDGSTVTAEFSGSEINFQTFNFTGFSDLSYVEIPTPDWSLDNLVVSIPEPTSGTLLVIGGLMLGAWNLRRHRD